MWIRFIVFLTIFGFAEYYSFVVVRSSLRTLPPVGRTTLISLYILLSVVTYLGILFFRSINWAELPHMPRNIYVAFTLGFLVGKILILLVMLTDEARRIFV